MEQKQPCGNTGIVNFVGFVKFNLRLPMPRVENEHGTKLRKNLSQLLLLEKVDLKLELTTF